MVLVQVIMIFTSNYIINGSVFPKMHSRLSTSTFILKGAMGTPSLRMNIEKAYFLQTSVNFTICNAQNYSVAVTDWSFALDTYSRDNMLRFKRRLMKEFGYAYFAFPEDEQAFNEQE